MDLSEIFWGASVEELKRGYVENKEHDKLICLCCGEVFEIGVIYHLSEKYLDARKAMDVHIKEKHQSMFHFLLEMDKKYTSLTETQKQLIKQFYEGLSDKEIAKKMDGSTSTIRNQRFQLRERAKQAKVFLSIMEILEEKMNFMDDEKLIPIHRNATSIDERYAITESERDEYLKKYFHEEKLISFPKKQKRIIIILQHIANLFDKKKIYKESEVNEILKTIYHDYVTIRRYLIEYGFLDRKADGSEYWVKL